MNMQNENWYIIIIGQPQTEAPQIKENKAGVHGMHV